MNSLPNWSTSTCSRHQYSLSPTARFNSCSWNWSVWFPDMKQHFYGDSYFHTSFVFLLLCVWSTCVTVSVSQFGMSQFHLERSLMNGTVKHQDQQNEQISQRTRYFLLNYFWERPWNNGHCLTTMKKINLLKLRFPNIWSTEAIKK